MSAWGRIGEYLRSNPHIWKALIVVGGIGFGLVLLAIFVVNHKAPTHREIALTPVSVRIIEVRALPFRVEARGHGVARPAETWQAVANVAGRVVERHPDLESGVLLPAGTFLLALDPSRYELAIVEAHSELATLEAERAQLDTEEVNVRRLLELERKRLNLTEQELTRIKNLAESGAVSLSRLDEQHRATLTQRQAVASLENSNALFPSHRELLEARRVRAGTRLAQAKRDLKDTRFFAPYDLRLQSVQAEMHQFVSAGQILFQADNIDAAEVEAHIPVSMMRRLAAFTGATDPEKATPMESGVLDFSTMSAEVEIVAVPGVVWTGRITRIASGLDPITRTLRVVVRVEDPYRDARPPKRPPLQRGVYTRVRLSKLSPEDLLVVPSSAVQGGSVYLANENDQLERRAVEVAFEQGDLTVIVAGLRPGERVVVDDLPWAAFPGMALATFKDEELERWMQSRANGGKP